MIERPEIHRYSLLDAGRLCSLFRSGEIFFAAGDDFSDIGKLAAFVENTLRSPNVYIMGKDPRYEAFIFIPMHTTSCYCAHTIVKEGHRGKDAFRHLVLSVKHVFANSPCRAIIGFTRDGNKSAKALNSYLGMKVVGRTHGTLKFNGQMVDEVIFQCTVDDYNNRYGKTYGFIERLY